MYIIIYVVKNINKVKYMILRQRVANILKYVIILTSLAGTIYGLFMATTDGYSHWTKRLLYFTTQSNVWIGVTYLGLIILSFFPSDRFSKARTAFYYCKYLFTVSIAMTCLVFCCFLGPFADESYRPWSLYSFLAHVITPVLTFIEFYLDTFKYEFKLRHVFQSIIAPIIYYTLAIILGVFGLDFGRGDPFPYFFLDFNSDVGLFGFKFSPLPNMGSVWWILLFSLIMIGIAFLLMKTHHSSRKQNSK